MLAGGRLLPRRPAVRRERWAHGLWSILGTIPSSSGKTLSKVTEQATVPVHPQEQYNQESCVVLFSLLKNIELYNVHDQPYTHGFDGSLLTPSLLFRCWPSSDSSA